MVPINRIEHDLSTELCQRIYAQEFKVMLHHQGLLCPLMNNRISVAGFCMGVLHTSTVLNFQHGWSEFLLTR